MKLPRVKSIDPDSVTISGFSAGAFQASNLHFIYSSLFKGAALISGGPYSYFMERSQKEATQVKVANLVPHAFNAYVNGKIDSLKNIQDSKVLVFFGE